MIIKTTKIIAGIILVFLAYILLPIVQLLTSGLIQLTITALILGASLSLIRLAIQLIKYGVKGVPLNIKLKDKLEKLKTRHG